MTERLGLTPPIEVTGFAAAVDLCARAEQLGYTDVWSAEVGAVDAFSPLAAIAVKTERVRLGTALVPVKIEVSEPAKQTIRLHGVGKDLLDGEVQSGDQRPNECERAQVSAA